MLDCCVVRLFKLIKYFIIVVRIFNIIFFNYVIGKCYFWLLCLNDFDVFVVYWC